MGHPHGVMVTCWVVPGASRSQLKGLRGDAVKVRVTAPPEGGRANAEVCRLLSSVCGAPAELVSGAASRSKRVFLRGADRSEVVAALG